MVFPHRSGVVRPLRLHAGENCFGEATNDIVRTAGVTRGDSLCKM